MYVYIYIYIFGSARAREPWSSRKALWILLRSQNSSDLPTQDWSRGMDSPRIGEFVGTPDPGFPLLQVPIVSQRLRPRENMVGVNLVLAELVKFKHGLYESCGIECFEGIMLEPCLLQPCFHVAASSRSVIHNSILLLLS